MNKHTPGPWSIKRGTITWEIVSESEYVGRVYSTSRSEDISDDAEGVANAALIAAAPDLLAALRGVIRSAAYESGQAEPSLRELTVGIKYLDAARAAIAKAEGGAK